MAAPLPTGFGNMISGMLSPDVVSKASSLVGETPEVTRRGFEGAIPTVLGGILNQTSGQDGASVLNGMLGTSGVGSGLVENLGSMFSGGSETEGLMRTGSRLVGSMFGSNLGAVTDSLSSSTGMRRSSATSMLAMAAPLVLSFLNRYKISRGLSDSALLDQLRDQKSSIMGLLPRGISGMFTSRPAVDRPVVDRPADVGREREVYVSREPVAAPRAPAWKRWLPLAIAAAIAIVLLLWLAGRTRNAVASLALPGGVRISAPQGSLPWELARYLASGSTDVPRTFTFDNLTFDTATSRLTPDSAQTVGNVAAILKAYPTVKVQIQGHTDNTGDPAANRNLSLARATEVRNSLAAAGIAADRLDVAGFGSDRPIASNDTPEGRARNRRTDLVVTQR